MAASMRLLFRRVIRLSHRNVNVTAAGAPGRPAGCWEPPSCRCFSEAAGDRSTHFGFETVPETEKAKRSEVSLCMITNFIVMSLLKSSLTHRQGKYFRCCGDLKNVPDNSVYTKSMKMHFCQYNLLNVLKVNLTVVP